MTWESIAIIAIMLSSLIYGFRTILKIKKIEISTDTDHNKLDKKIRLISNAKISGIIAVVFIILLFFMDLIKRNLYSD